MLEQFETREDVVHAGLVQAHLAAGHESGHLRIARYEQAARFAAVIDRVEQQHVRRVEQQGHQRQAKSAAVEDLDRRGEVPAVAERLDATYAEAFVGPQQVADAEDDDALRGSD